MGRDDANYVVNYRRNYHTAVKNTYTNSYVTMNYKIINTHKSSFLPEHKFHKDRVFILYWLPKTAIDI